MEKVESFKLDHNKVKAPFVRKCCVLEGKMGDKVSKFYNLIKKLLEQQLCMD